MRNRGVFQPPVSGRIFFSEKQTKLPGKTSWSSRIRVRSAVIHDRATRSLIRIYSAGHASLSHANRSGRRTNRTFVITTKCRPPKGTGKERNDNKNPTDYSTLLLSTKGRLPFLLPEPSGPSDGADRPHNGILGYGFFFVGGVGVTIMLFK